MNQYRKTRMMNIIGAMGIVILGVMLLSDKLNGQFADVLVAFAVYTLLAAIPFGTARALSPAASIRLRTTMFWVNWSLIAMWCLGVVVALYVHQSLGMYLIGILIFVIPEWINIRALRSLAERNMD
jgi:hypothetical protein